MLKRAYRYDKSIILEVLKQLLGGSEVYISSHVEAWEAYADYETGNADFSDYFIARIKKNRLSIYLFI